MCSYKSNNETKTIITKLVVNGKEITEKIDICNNKYSSNVGTSLIKNLKSTPTSYTGYMHALLKLVFSLILLINLNYTIP